MTDQSTFFNPSSSQLVTGVSSFGMKATNLLNTLDANFDQMFNPIAEMHQVRSLRHNLQNHDHPS